MRKSLLLIEGFAGVLTVVVALAALVNNDPAYIDPPAPVASETSVVHAAALDVDWEWTPPTAPRAASGEATLGIAESGPSWSDIVGPPPGFYPPLPRRNATTHAKNPRAIGLSPADLEPAPLRGPIWRNP
jgi:hypothetical protein